MSTKKSIIYIDGFNFYYGAVRGTDYKWLDLEKCFRYLRQSDDIQQINYFTAIVTGPTRTNQETYLKALQTRPLIRIIHGKFKPKNSRCNVAACAYAGDKRFVIQEEKRTDVNIGIQIVDDAIHKRANRLVLVSGDSDLVPALSMAKAYSPEIELIVYVPSRSAIRGAAVELRAAADKDRNFPLELLSRSQFPSMIDDGRGATISKPLAW